VLLFLKSLFPIYAEWSKNYWKAKPRDCPLGDLHDQAFAKTFSNSHALVPNTDESNHVITKISRSFIISSIEEELLGSFQAQRTRCGAIQLHATSKACERDCQDPSVKNSGYTAFL
jgi:hypothetical protein